jgi:hypothetical protein
MPTEREPPHGGGPRLVQADAPARPIIPAAFLLTGAAALAVALAPDAAFTAVFTGVLRRAAKPGTLADWHAVQRAAGFIAASAAVAAGVLIATWRRISPAIDRLDAFLRRDGRDRAFDAAAVLVAVFVAHGIALRYGELRMDDYSALEDARAGLRAVLLAPSTGHFLPLWRLENVVLYRLWGSNSVPYRWWELASVWALGYCQARLLKAWGIGRGARLLGTVTLCAWTQWAQVTMGFWSLTVCVKILIAIAIGARAAVADDWPAALRKAVIAASMLGAVLVDSPGALVVPAVVVASVAWRLAAGASLRAAVRESEWTIVMACCASLIVLGGHWVANMDSPNGLVVRSAASGMRVALFLLTFGTVGALVMPVVSTQLPAAWLRRTSLVVPVLGAALLVLAWRRASRAERAALASLLAMAGSAVVLLATTRAYSDYSFMVLWVHYIAYLYVPFVGILAVAWNVWWRGRLARIGTQVQALALTLVAFLGAQEACSAVAARLLVQGGRGWERLDAVERAQMIATVRDSILVPLTRIVPDGAVIPQLLGRHLNARFPRLHPLLGLSFYAQAAGIAPTRFHWVVGPFSTKADADDPAGTQRVSTMRSVVDPAFRAALQRPSYWRDTYFASDPISAEATPRAACDAAERASSPLAGDADQRHWLLLRVATPSDDSMPVRVIFHTDFRPIATYDVQVEPRVTGCMRLELLNLAELAMSDRITVTGLRGGEARGVSIAGLFPSSRPERAGDRAATRGAGRNSPP